MMRRRWQLPEIEKVEQVRLDMEIPIVRGIGGGTK
jgi:hypothetical protein